MQLKPDSLSTSSLTPIAQQALQNPDAVVTEWRSEEITYAGTGIDSRGLFRVSSTALERGQNFAWSSVLKIFAPLPDGSTDSPTSAHYWKREALAYTTDLLRNLPPGLAAPRCYGIDEKEGAL